MRLSPEAREIFLEAAREAFTRRLTAEEVFNEVVRVVREARTPEEIEAAGRLVGRVNAFGKMLLSAGAAAEKPVQFEESPPEPDPAGAAAAAAVAAPEPADAVAEEAA